MKTMAALLLLAGLAFGQAGPATRPAFTIGKETTVIDGPVRADGTIDYIAAINKLIGAGVKNADNAAIPLLMLKAGEGIDQPSDAAAKEALQTLHADLSPGALPKLEFLIQFVKRKNGTESRLPTSKEFLEISDLEARLQEHPWKAANFPQAAEWMKASEPGMKLVEDACARTRFYIPFREALNDGKPASAIGGMPEMTLSFTPREVLLARAMMRAGDGDLAGSLEDLRRLRVLARLEEQEHTNMMHVTDLAMETAALRGYAGLANSGQLTASQLTLVRKEIEALPELKADDPVRTQVDEMAALDLMMQCIRGQSDRVMRLMAFQFDQAKPIDIGDWAHADWDAALREVVRIFTQTDAGADRNFAHQMEDLDRQFPKNSADDTPSAMDAVITSGGNFAPLKARVEAFLKLRAGESRQDFSRRVTRWLMGETRSDLRRSAALEERPWTLRAMALTSVSLAEYRLAHGEFPEALEKLGTAASTDGFSGKAFCYRREGTGYVLWSVGMNQKDDGGTRDDLVIRAGEALAAPK